MLTLLCNVKVIDAFIHAVTHLCSHKVVGVVNIAVQGKVMVMCLYLCSHRPVDVNNMYNAVQVKLLMKADDLSDVPEFDEVFREEEEVPVSLPSSFLGKRSF